MLSYFAYGSNCNPDVMERKGVPFVSRTRASLKGFRLLFNKKSLRETLPGSIGYANINPCSESVTEGVLYEIEARYLSLLDESERHPEHYKRIEVQVITESGLISCWAYQAQPDKIREELVPTRTYLNHILAGSAYLSDDYHEALSITPTYRSECVECRQNDEIIFVVEQDEVSMFCQSCFDSLTVQGEVRA